MKRAILIFLLVLLLTGCAQAAAPATEPHSHSYAAQVTAPTCTEAGVTRFTCPCGDTYAETAQPLGHSYVSTVTAPTYTSEGFTHHLCQVCGHEYTDAFTRMPDEVVSALAEKNYLLPFETFSREREQNPEFVMVHFISAVVIDPKTPYDPALVRGIFTDYEVSVHYIIHRDGTVQCYIPENLVAYHAGKGTWQEDEKYTNRMNDYAIGIEVMAMGSQADMAQYMSAGAYGKLDPQDIGYTDAQYEALRALVRDICGRNNIPLDRQHIIGHEEYSPDKTDPGELFSWERLLAP